MNIGDTLKVQVWKASWATIASVCFSKQFGALANCQRHLRKVERGWVGHSEATEEAPAPNKRLLRRNVRKACQVTAEVAGWLTGCCSDYLSLLWHKHSQEQQLRGWKAYFNSHLQVLVQHQEKVIQKLRKACLLFHAVLPPAREPTSQTRNTGGTTEECQALALGCAVLNIKLGEPFCTPSISRRSKKVGEIEPSLLEKVWGFNSTLSDGENLN